MKHFADTVPCRYCGEAIGFRKCNGKTVPIDPEPVWCIQDTHGKTYLMGNGQTFIGTEVGDAYEGPATVYAVNTFHRMTCKGGMRKARERKKRMARPGNSQRMRTY